MSQGTIEFVNDEPRAKWVCPKCQHGNENRWNDKEDGASCEQCDEEFKWDEIIDPEEQDYAAELLQNIHEKDVKNGLFG